MKDGDPIELVWLPDGTLGKRCPWCDCKGKARGFGLVKRKDGHWVRPCCLRPVNRWQWESWQRQKDEALNGSESLNDKSEGQDNEER